MPMHSPLKPTDDVARILRNLSAQSMMDAETAFRTLPKTSCYADTDAFVKIGGGSFRYAYDSIDRETGEVSRIFEARLIWGRCVYAIPVTLDLAIAMAKNFARIASRSSGRGKRSDFTVRAGS
jgi:hypothetical protein